MSLEKIINKIKMGIGVGLIALSSFLPQSKADEFANLRIERPFVIRPQYYYRGMKEGEDLLMNLSFEFSRAYIPSNWFVCNGKINYEISLIDEEAGFLGGIGEIIDFPREGIIDDYFRILLYYTERERKLYFTPFKLGEQAPKEKRFYFQIEDAWIGERDTDDGYFFTFEPKRTESFSIKKFVGPKYDVNKDGCINVTDLILIRTNMGYKGSEIWPPEADVDKNGVVNISDLVAVRTDLGEGCD